jgi:hypothetical protein
MNNLPPPPPPMNNLPPPPHPIEPHLTPSNKPQESIKRTSIKKIRPALSLQDQIRNPGIKLKSVESRKKPDLKKDKGNNAPPCLSDALMGAMSKIRLATRDNELYEAIDIENIYQEREDDW